jgi:hypothetical protein
VSDASETPFACLWKCAAADLGFRLLLDYDAHLLRAASVRVAACVPEFGAPKGMLIVHDFDTIVNLADEIVAAGYGYSTIRAPKVGAEYDRESFVEMLADWGWSGPANTTPAWLIEYEVSR